MIFRRRRKEQASQNARVEEPHKDKMTLAVGSILLDRYKCTGVIGVGDVSVVFLARDLRLPTVQRNVAIKERLNLASDPKLREMTLRSFEREARILSDVSHPAIPVLHDYISDQDMAYLVMDYVSGRDLETIINAMPTFLPFGMVKKWALEMCDVLEHLHTHRPDPILFCHISPANIIIDDSNVARLVGFSQAQVMGSDHPASVLVNEGYSPPEQYHGDISPASDLYALGATLHYALTRVDPRTQQPFSFSERPIRDGNPSVPEGFAEIVMKALAHNPEERWRSAKEMAEAAKALG